MSQRILSSNTRGLTGFAGLLTRPAHRPSRHPSVAKDSMRNIQAHSSGTVQDSHLIPFSSLARTRGIGNKTATKIVYAEQNTKFQQINVFLIIRHPYIMRYIRQNDKETETYHKHNKDSLLIQGVSDNK